jgi:hypothetical protein
MTWESCLRRAYSLIALFSPAIATKNSRYELKNEIILK